MKRAKEGDMRKNAGAVSGTAIGKAKIGLCLYRCGFLPGGMI